MFRFPNARTALSLFHQFFKRNSQTLAPVHWAAPMAVAVGGIHKVLMRYYYDTFGLTENMENYNKCESAASHRCSSAPVLWQEVLPPSLCQVPRNRAHGA